MAADQVLESGQVLRFTHVAESEGSPLPLTFSMPPPDEVHALLSPAVSYAFRARLVRHRVADDQVAYVLRDLPSKVRMPVAVLDPAHLLSAVQNRISTELREQLRTCGG